MELKQIELAKNESQMTPGYEKAVKKCYLKKTLNKEYVTNIMIYNSFIEKVRGLVFDG